MRLFMYLHFDIVSYDSELEFRTRIQWNLYWADILETFPSVRLIEGVRLMKVCSLTIKIQRFL